MARANVNAEQLRLFIERIERLEEERRGIGADIAGVYQEAKANRYDANRHDNRRTQQSHGL